MHFPCLCQENEIVVGREKQLGHNVRGYEGFLHGNKHPRAPPSCTCVIHLSYTEHCPMRWDFHRGRSDGFIRRQCIARRHCAIGSDAYKPLMISRQFPNCKKRGRGASMPPSEIWQCTRRKDARGQGGGYARRGGAALRPIRGPYPRPLIALKAFAGCDFVAARGRRSGISPPSL